MFYCIYYQPFVFCPFIIERSTLSSNDTEGQLQFETLHAQVFFHFLLLPGLLKDAESLNVDAVKFSTISLTFGIMITCGNKIKLKNRIIFTVLQWGNSGVASAK